MLFHMSKTRLGIDCRKKCASCVQHYTIMQPTIYATVPVAASNESGQRVESNESNERRAARQGLRCDAIAICEDDYSMDGIVRIVRVRVLICDQMLSRLEEYAGYVWDRLVQGNGI
jgi:hypothetical protein